MRQQLLRATVCDIAPNPRAIPSLTACEVQWQLPDEHSNQAPRNLARILHGKQPLPPENEDPEASIVDIADGYGTGDWEDDLDDDSDEDDARANLKLLIPAPHHHLEDGTRGTRRNQRKRRHAT